jgi:hypothetical protein
MKTINQKPSRPAGINLKAMKRIFTLSAFALLFAFSFTGCVRDSGIINNDESYWLSKERGEVVYSDTYCSYFVVETFYGYTIIRSYGGYKPYEGAIVYGNFSNMGTRDMYNRSGGYVFTGTITDYWLTYIEAQDALDFYCPFGGKGAAVKREFKKSSFSK